MLHRLALILTGLVLFSACGSPQITKPFNHRLIEASWQSLSSYTFSVRRETHSSDLNHLDVYRETVVQNPNTRQIDTLQDDRTAGIKIEKSRRYINRWYEMRDNKCIVKGGNDFAYNRNIIHLRETSMYSLDRDMLEEIKQLEGSEYNGVPAKHYTQTDVLQRGPRHRDDSPYQQILTTEWWITDDDLVLWVQFTREEVIEGQRESISINTYTLEQYNQAVTIEIPDICTQ